LCSSDIHQDHVDANIDHISLGKQSIANKYAPINTQNIGFITENIKLNTLYINVEWIDIANTEYRYTAIRIPVNTDIPVFLTCIF
jgi:hypothetical protein